MKKKGRYKEKLDWDDMTQGEAAHHIGKKMTEKVEKSKKDFKENIYDYREPVIYEFTELFRSEPKIKKQLMKFLVITFILTNIMKPLKMVLYLI